MVEFIQVLLDYPFMRNAFLVGVLASLACGITGTYVVVKKLTSISGGIAHAVLGGVGIAYYLGVNPLWGALVFALLAALVLGVVSIRLKQYEDTTIGALWAVGMAVGIMFISRTPGYNVDLMTYLFGNILMVSRTDLWIIAGVDAIIISLVVLFHTEFLTICFDKEHARLRGVPVDLLYLLLLCVIALTVVVLIRVVGLILVIALLSLPAAISKLYTRSLGGMMVGASVLGFMFTTSGLMSSFQFDTPAGATIVIIAGIAYLGALIFRRLIEVLRTHFSH